MISLYKLPSAAEQRDPHILYSWKDFQRRFDLRSFTHYWIFSFRVFNAKIENLISRRSWHIHSTVFVFLFQACSSEVMMLRVTRRYDPVTDTVLFANNRTYSRENYCKAGMSYVIENLLHFCRCICSMSLDNVHYALLTAIVIFSGKLFYMLFLFSWFRLLKKTLGIHIGWLCCPSVKISKLHGSIKLNLISNIPKFTASWNTYKIKVLSYRMQKILMHRFCCILYKICYFKTFPWHSFTCNYEIWQGVRTYESFCPNKLQNIFCDDFFCFSS